ncbi:MAG: KamA family radical SAM protein [Clostridiaceae bacterium]|nr:KamA family radical SAM protein [Clostridiaceae bacterium]
MENARRAEERFEKLRNEIQDYESIKGQILTGIEDYEKIEYQKKKILKHLNASEDDYRDYHWQMKNRFTSSESLSKIIELSGDETKYINEVAARYRFAVSPYYLSLVEPDNPGCAIRKQAIPMAEELNDIGELDPMDEKGTAIHEIITRRYPDRLIIKITNVCGMFCRFCQRRRLIGETDKVVPRSKIQTAIEYVRENSEIRDVLITGGDAFLASDELIDWMLKELRAIPHVEIIRFGTRTPVTLPQRITKNLVGILKKYHPVFVNTHFNHPREITPEAKTACEMLADAGIPLGNQMVLLNGVNNDKYVVRKLNQKLLTIRVKPYYIFHPKTVKGTSHFWVKIEEGLEIMESLRGRTSGLAIPTYIINGPKGLGKTPIMPNYLLCLGKDKATFRNWQGKSFEIENFGPGA